MMRNFIIAAGASLALAACSGEESDTPRDDQPPVPVAQNPASPTTTRTAERAGMGDDEVLGSDAVMQGQWFASTMAGAPAALFGPPQSEASFSVRCSGGELVFVRSTLVEEGGDVEMALMAGGRTRRIDASVDRDPMPQVTGRLAADDPFAEVLGSTQEPIAVAVAGGASFRMPSSPQLRDVVNDCAA